MMQVKHADLIEALATVKRHVDALSDEEFRKELDDSRGYIYDIVLDVMSAHRPLLDDEIDEWADTLAADVCRATD